MTLRGLPGKGGTSRGASLVIALAVGATLLLSRGISPATAAQAQPSVADVFIAQAILAYEEKRYDDALNFIEEALKEDPDNLDALYYTGLVRIAQKRPELAVEVLEKARAKEPTNVYVLFQLGVAFFVQEQYDRAEPLLNQVFTREPRLDSLGYYVGFMRYRKKDYQGALRAFAAGASSDPDIQQLTKVYTALALAILGLPERAAAEIEEALKLQPASPLTGPAERLRDTIIAARGRERPSFPRQKCREIWGEACDRFGAEVRVGFTYDTNVAVVPEPFNDPSVEDLRRQKTRSPGEVVSVRFDYTWLKTGPWEATASFQFFESRNEVRPKFDIQNYLGSGSGTYRGVLADLQYQLGLQYAYDSLDLGNDDFLRRNTVNALGTLVENSHNLSTLLGRFQIKEYSHDLTTPPEEKHDAQNWMVGLVHTLLFEEGKHLLRAGYQFDVEDAVGRNFKYRGHRFLAGAQYTLPWGGTRLKYDLDFHLVNYRHANTILPVTAPGTRKRRDHELTHVFRVEQPLPYSLTLAAEYQAITTHSNIPVFSFGRDVYSLILSWQY